MKTKLFSIIFSFIFLFVIHMQPNQGDRIISANKISFRNSYVEVSGVIQINDEPVPHGVSTIYIPLNSISYIEKREWK